MTDLLYQNFTGISTMTPDKQFIISCCKKGETGHAQMFALMFKGKAGYDAKEKQWYIFDDIWQPDIEEHVKNLVSRQIASVYEKQAAIENKAGNNDLADDLRGAAYAVRQNRGIENTLKLAQIQPEIILDNSKWNHKQMMFAAQDALIDLKTGSVRPILPSDYVRTTCPTRYNPKAESPLWEKFLNEIFNGNNDLIHFMHKLLGYSITGLSTEHILPMFVGIGRNGKDTLLQILEDTLGLDVISPVPSEILISGYRNPGAAQPYIYDLRDKRLAYCNETGDGQRLDAAQVKLLTGGSTLTARTLHSKPVTFKPQHKLFFVSNHLPQANSDDYALWKRVLVINFENSFVDNPNPFNSNEKQIDKNLRIKLQAESEGILNWLIQGCLLWQSEGLNPPKCVTDWTQQYRDQEDVIGDFISDEMITGDDKQILISVLYSWYADWTKESGYRPLGKKRFKEKILARGFGEKRKSEGIYILGIGKKPVKSEDDVNPEIYQNAKNDVLLLKSVNTNINEILVTVNKKYPELKFTLGELEEIM